MTHSTGSAYVYVYVWYFRTTNVVINNVMTSVPISRSSLLITSVDNRITTDRFVYAEWEISVMWARPPGDLVDRTINLEVSSLKHLQGLLYSESIWNVIIWIRGQQ